MAAAFTQLNQGLPPPPCYSDDEKVNDISTCVSPSSTIPIANNIKFKPKSPFQPLLQRNKKFIIPINITNIKPEEKKNDRIREKAVDELIATEITYLNNLNKLLNLYIIPLSQNRKILSTDRHSIIFPNSIQSIIKLNTTLLKSLQSNRKYIGKSMISFIPYLKMYENYMKNHENTTKLLCKMRSSRASNDVLFIKFLERKKQETNGVTLESFLILPIQRIPRYELCLKEIIKRTNNNNLDKNNLIKCYDKIRNLNFEINKKLKEYECKLKVHEIEKKIVNISFSLVTPSRYYIYDGFITKISRKKHIKYLFILFNDILIYCDSDSNKNKLILHRKLEIDEYFSIQPICYLSDDSNNEKCKCYFEIRSLQKSFLCYTETIEEREKWIELISKCLDDNINKKRSDSYVKYRKSMSEIDGGRMLETAPILISNNMTNTCMMKQCNNKFGIITLRKKYHCTYCGKIICSDCCKNSLKHFNPNKRNDKKDKSYRVCDLCWNDYKTPYFLNIDQMNFVSKNIKINKENDMKQENNNDDLWDKYGFDTVNNNMINNKKMNDVLDDLFDNNNNNNNSVMDDPFEDLWNVTKGGDKGKTNERKIVMKYKLDYNHVNVQNLRLFGFSNDDIGKAWNMMQMNKNDKNIIPDHGELFVQKLLDSLQQVQKNKFKLNNYAKI